MYLLIYLLIPSLGPKVQRSSSSHIAKRAQYKLDWTDIERKRSEWTFTAAQLFSIQSPFQHYGSTSYVNPGNASIDLLDSLKRRFEGKETLHLPNSGNVRRPLSADREGRIARWLKATENVTTAATRGSLSSWPKLSGDINRWITEVEDIGSPPWQLYEMEGSDYHHARPPQAVVVEANGTNRYEMLAVERGSPDAPLEMAASNHFRGHPLYPHDVQGPSEVYRDDCFHERKARPKLPALLIPPTPQLRPIQPQPIQLELDGTTVYELDGKPRDTSQKSPNREVFPPSIVGSMPDRISSLRRMANSNIEH
jgi:hypothetical protein